MDLGSSYALSDQLAAFLFAQLEQRDRVQASRRRIWECYNEHLKDWAGAHGVRLPVIPPHCEQPYHMFYMLLPSLSTRQKFIAYLKERGILSVFHYLPLHLSEMGLKLGGRPGQHPVTEDVSDRLLRLPFYNHLSIEEQTGIVEAVRGFSWRFGLEECHRPSTADFRDVLGLFKCMNDTRDDAGALVSLGWCPTGIEGPSIRTKNLNHRDITSRIGKVPGLNANDSGAAPRAKGHRLSLGAETGKGIPRSTPSAKLVSVGAAVFPWFLTAILAVVFFYSLYGIWGQNLKLPITRAGGDYLATAIFAKTAMQTGWCATNTHLGAPHGFECYDFPMPDGIHLGFFALIGRFTNDAVFAINVYYILGFVLIALTSLFVFRSFGFSTIPSVPASLLFAFLPHHYKRGEYHLFLSSYYLIPLMVMVIVWMDRGESLVTRSPGKGPGYRFTKKGAAGAIICILMGCGGIYYAAFALLFLLTTGLLLSLRGCRMLELLPAGLAGALIVSTVVANLMPNLLYFQAHGRDPEVAQRSFEEADMYGMKIAQLLLPITEHRLPAFERLKRRYLSGTDPIVRERESETMVALGLVMSLGFLILIVDLLNTLATVTGSILSAPLFGRLNLAAVLVATLGGFGSLFNLLIFPEIRVYARISVYIAFFSLVALLNGIARLQRHYVWTSRMSCL